MCIRDRSRAVWHGLDEDRLSCRRGGQLAPVETGEERLELHLGQCYRDALRLRPDKLFAVQALDGHHEARRQDDDCAARPPHTSLRHRRNRQRELATQNPPLSPAETLARDGCANWKTTPPRARSRPARGVPFGRRSGDPIGCRLTERRPTWRGQFAPRRPIRLPSSCRHQHLQAHGVATTG